MFIRLVYSIQYAMRVAQDQHIWMTTVVDQVASLSIWHSMQAVIHCMLCQIDNDYEIEMVCYGFDALRASLRGELPNR